MSEMEDTSMQKVGMRDDKEKEMYEPYKSRERYYEPLYQRVRRSGREGTHHESLQVHPIITDQEPYITGNPKATCGTASGNSAVRVGVDLEDGIRSYGQYRCIDASRCC
jgi:hypothetical protein